MRIGDFLKIGIPLLVAAFIVDSMKEKEYDKKEREKRQEQYEMEKNMEKRIENFKYIKPLLLEKERDLEVKEDELNMSTNNKPDQINNRKFIADGVSFTVPEGWSVASDDVRAEMEAHKKKFGATSSSLKYLLYPTANINTYGYPFISIGFEYLGINMKNDENFIEYSEIAKKNYKPLMTSFKTSMPDKLSQLENLAFYSDIEKREILWKFSNQIEGYGDITSIAWFSMSESGIIRIFVNVPSKDMSSTFSALENIKNSLEK